MRMLRGRLTGAPESPHESASQGRNKSNPYPFNWQPSECSLYQPLEGRIDVDNETVLTGACPSAPDQEALTRAKRHSERDRTVVRLAHMEARTRIGVRDWGGGLLSGEGRAGVPWFSGDPRARAAARRMSFDRDRSGPGGPGGGEIAGPGPSRAARQVHAKDRSSE